MPYLKDDFRNDVLADHWVPQTAVAIRNGIVDIAVPQWGFHLVTKEQGFEDFVLTAEVRDVSGGGIGLITRWNSPINYYMTNVRAHRSKDHPPRAFFHVFSEHHPEKHYAAAARTEVELVGDAEFDCESWYQVELRAAANKLTLSVGEVGGEVKECCEWVDANRTFPSGAVGFFQAEGSHGEYRNFEVKSI